MRVGDKMIYWEEGKCVIFDDTHKHEVWNEPMASVSCCYSTYTGPFRDG